MSVEKCPRPRPRGEMSVAESSGGTCLRVNDQGDMSEGEIA